VQCCWPYSVTNGVHRARCPDGWPTHGKAVDDVTRAWSGAAAEDGSGNESDPCDGLVIIVRRVGELEEDCFRRDTSVTTWNIDLNRYGTNRVHGRSEGQVVDVSNRNMNMNTSTLMCLDGTIFEKPAPVAAVDMSRRNDNVETSAVDLKD